jgi:predicted TPR repeat methyltransferase
MPAVSQQPGAAPPTPAGEALAKIEIPNRARIAPPPSAAVGLTREGLALFAVGEFHKAEQAFRVVADLAPNHALAWNNLALVLVSLEALEEAAAALQRSVALDPAQLTAWSSLAGVLVRLGRTDEAERACTNALALDPDCTEAWQTCAFARVQAEDFAGAAEAFTRTLDLAGESAALYLNLGATLLKCGRFPEAAASLARASALDPDSDAVSVFKPVSDLIIAAMDGEAPVGDAPADQTFKTAFLLLNGANQSAAAARVAEAWARAFPDNIEAAHLRDAALSRAADRQPAALVAQHFDGIAEDFDDRLVRRLGYRGPERLLELIAAQVPAEGALDILDLGCGTGLCAPMLRPFARRLVGVDLSPRMLDKAQALALYDDLEVADLLSTLDGAEARWDLLIAADTFPYLGDLDAVFARAAAALRVGGWFAFSTESAEGDGFVLKTNGRYAQGPGYIGRLAADRFAIVSHVAAPIRREAGEIVVGEFFLLRRA